MQELIKLKIREQVELQISHNGSRRMFLARIQDFNENELVIDRPIIDRVYLTVETGQLVDIVFNRPDASYRYEATIVDKRKSGPMSVIVFDYPKVLKRIQRRSHFRLPVEIPIGFRIVAGESGKRKSPFKFGKIINLSGGGVKFKVSQKSLSEIIPGSKLNIKFDLKESGKRIGCESLVLSTKFEENDPRIGLVMIRFLDITFSQKESIIVHNIKYQQRYLIKKIGNI